MKKLRFLLFTIILIGCTGQNESLITNLDNISRYLQITDDKIEDQLVQLEIFYTENPVVGGLAHNRGVKIHTASSELQSVLNETVLEKEDIIAYMEAFSQVIEDLDLESKISNKISNQHIEYWISSKKNLAESRNLIIYDIKLAELEILREIIRVIHSKSYIFNYLKPLIIDSTDIIMAGDIYSAKICFSAFDTTRYPTIKIDGEFLEVQDVGYGIYQYKSNKPGTKSINGEMIVQRNDRKLDTFRFKKNITIK